MKYINTKSGFVMETDSVLAGIWVLETEYTPDTHAEYTPETEVKTEEVKALDQETTGDEAYDAITVAQIKQELDAFGIEYDKKASKRALYDLMTAQGE